MSNRAPSRNGTRLVDYLFYGEPDAVPGQGERRASDTQHRGAETVDRGGVASVRESVIHDHLADSKLALAIYDLIVAGHNLNRWDLTDEAVNALCDSARRYSAEYERVLAERGLSHE